MIKIKNKIKNKIKKNILKFLELNVNGNLELETV